MSSDDDWSTAVFSSADPSVERMWEIGTRLIQDDGGDPFDARRLRGLMQGSEFTRGEGHAIAAGHHGTLGATRKRAQFIDSLLSIPR